MNRILRSGSKALLFTPPSTTEGRSSHLLFPTDSELNPPFKKNWPSYTSTTNYHSQYETALIKNYDEHNWTKMDVAWAYLDQIPGCRHPAEKVVCYLHAAMWMAKQLDPESEMEYSKLCGLKCIIMEILKNAFSIAYKSLNPGMHLYVIRLVLGIMRKIAQMPESKHAFKDEDLSYLQMLLKKLIKLSLLFLFWNLPAVSVSEAVKLDHVSGKLHSNFIFGLQSLNPSHNPISSSDMKYQLFENDLLSLLHLKNASDSRARAMEELLLSQDRSWSDVVQALSSDLIPRDSEGWIIQSSNFRVHQQYSEITGFTIDTTGGHPSVQLKVLEADHNNKRIGLFSQEDISTMIQLDDLNIKLFFSLDPPSHNLDTKPHHPFQQWRYATDDIRDTEVLKSMFIADYLMKSFTVGSEVSSLPSFNQRPCKEGLTKALPKKLQKALRSIGEREGALSKHPNYRFWIEAKEMKFNVQHTGSKIECTFGEMEMTVKCHPMIRHEDGRLLDSDEDIDPHTRESSFANDMTDNYTNLEYYFPVFARLRQLSKLQVFVNMIRPLLQGFNPFESKMTHQTSTKKMEWVPAAISRTPAYISYGGVSFDPKLTPLEYGERLPWSGNEVTMVIVQREPKVSVITTTVSYVAPKGSAEASSSSTNFSDDDDESDSDEESGDGSARGSAKFLKAGIAAFAAGAISTEKKKKLEEKEEHDKLLQIQTAANSISAITGPFTYTPPIISGVTFRENNLRSTNDKLDNLLHSIHNDSTTLYQTKAADVSFQSRSQAPSSAASNIVSPKKLTSLPQHEAAESKAPQSIVETCTSSKTHDVVTSDSASKKESGLQSSDNLSIPSQTSALEVKKNPKSKASEDGTVPSQGGDDHSNDNLSIPSQTSALEVKKNPKSKASEDGTVPPQDGDDHSNDGKVKRGYITGYSGGKLVFICKSPKSVISEIVNNGFRFPEAGQDRLANNGDVINALYVLKNKITGEIYIGRSCDVLRRMSEHQNDVKNERKTVGKCFSSPEDVEFCIIPLPTDFSSLDMRFYEQLLISKAKYHGYIVINVIRAMKYKQFCEQLKIRGEKPYPES